MSVRWLNLLFPPRCGGCDQRIPYAEWRRGDDCLCRDCRASWELAKLETCPVCREAMIDCRCMPARSEEAGVTSLCKLAAYGKGTDGARTVCDRLVYRIKDRHVTNYERFLAKQLSPIVRAEITSRGWLARDGEGKLPFETVVTYCPRSPAMARSRGTDQAERVARNLAVELGLPFVRAFVHRAGGEQKGLRGQERQIRAQAAYRLRRGVSVTVRRVILVDDIVTSGATMAACTEALFSAGALSVIGVAAEYVVRKKEKKRKRT